jgi:hypothetical protein
MRPRSSLIWVVALAIGAALFPADRAAAAPQITIKARTVFKLEPVRRAYSGIVVRGQLLDKFSDEPVPWRRIRIELDGGWLDRQTDGEGGFDATFYVDPAGRQHDLTVTFSGDAQYTASEFRIEGLDVQKESLELTVSAPPTAEFDARTIELIAKARTDLGGVVLDVDVLYGDNDGDLEKIGTITTDATGRGSFGVSQARAGAPGRKRVRIEFAGDDAYNKAHAEATFVLSTDASISLEAGSTSLKYESKFKARGAVADSRGGPIVGEPVALVAGARRLAETITRDDGSFEFKVSASEFGEGKHNVQAVFEPTKSYLRSDRTELVSITVAAPQPVPMSYTIAAFAATAFAMIAFVALRTKPWQKWMAKLRREDDGEDDESEDGDPPALRHGLQQARPSLVSTLRRPADMTFSGMVRDSVTSHPVSDAAVVATNDDHGRESTQSAHDGIFAFAELAAGDWRIAVSAFGYCTERFSISTPHRGELRGARIDLVPVRERIFAMYRQVAEHQLPDRELWGIWTPRQIFDHVRDERPASALSDLTNFVEETYFSQRTPDESVLKMAERLVAQARAEDVEMMPGDTIPD